MAQHAQPPRVGSVGVGAQHQAPGEGVVFEDYLVDDPRPRFPEPHAVLAGDRLEEIVDLAVLHKRFPGVRGAFHPCLDQVVAVDGGGRGHPLPACLHELEDGHLPGYVLKPYAIGPHHQIALSGLKFLIFGVIQVG